MAERTQVAKKVYITAAGDESAHATPDAERLEFRFANGETLVVNPNDIGANCRTAALFHGLSQKIGDSYAGAKGDADTAYESAQTILERLINDDWVRQGEGVGARPSLVSEAVIAALEENGETVDDERKKGIVEKLKGKEARDRALANAVINSHYERIKAERAAERAAKAREKAEGKELDLGDF